MEVTGFLFNKQSYTDYKHPTGMKKLLDSIAQPGSMVPELVAVWAKIELEKQICEISECKRKRIMIKYNKLLK